MSAKYELMAREEGTYTVVMMARLLGIARQGFYRWRKQQDDDPDGGPRPGSRAARRSALAGRIQVHWEASRHAHGVRRIQADLADEGTRASRWLIAKIMRALGIAGLQVRSTRRTTIPAADADTREDLIRRDFRPPVPTTHLVGDITYLKTGEGWLYLATVIDLTTRMVVGWSTAPHMRTSLITDALNNAHDAGYVAGGAVFHSDRGSQYTSAEFARVARLLDVRLSVGRTGVCWDNAVAESFFASLKKEMYHQQHFPTRHHAHLAVMDYIEVFYNRRRRHSTLDYRTPAQTMAAFMQRTAPHNTSQAA